MNAQQVNKALEQEIQTLRNGGSPTRANAVVRLATAMIRVAGLELAYYRAMGKKTELAFFQGKK